MTAQLDYELKQSARRSIGIQILADGRVAVRAPKWVSRARIHAFVMSKSGWIERKRTELQAQLPPTGNFEPGSRFWHYGSWYPLKIANHPIKPALQLTADSFVLSPTHSGLAEATFTKWYKEAAQFYFEDRVAKLAAEHGFRYKQFKLSNAKHSWGACTSTGAIRINWRLVMVAPDISDYVICHELAHTVHMNHSAKFWALVEKVCPEWQRHRRWLHDNGAQLVVSGRRD